MEDWEVMTIPISMTFSIAEDKPKKISAEYAEVSTRAFVDYLIAGYERTHKKEVKDD